MPFSSFITANEAIILYTDERYRSSIYCCRFVAAIVPAPALTVQSFTITDLSFRSTSSDSLFFTIRSRDEFGNQSPVSNICAVGVATIP